MNTRLIRGYSMLCCCTSLLFAQSFIVHKFERTRLSDEYFSEGAGAGDIDNDGVIDVTSGPYWYKGPDFKSKHLIYPAKPQNRRGYANNFFSWVADINGDGWNDIVTVALPGTPGYVYVNPGKEKLVDSKGWERHEYAKSVGNESPQFVNLVGDEKPELICSAKGRMGYFAPTWGDASKPWTFHKISDEQVPDPFGHGLGVGDLNGDGRADVLIANGWFEQPADASANWPFHRAKFSDYYGGGDMLVDDVDGDGDADVITSLAAHEFGLAWYEQYKDGANTTWKQHLIMGEEPKHNRYGIMFTELHSLALADMNGDGQKDIVTGKTYWSHHDRSPFWNSGAVVYWFEKSPKRNNGSVDYIPHLADSVSGIGRQLTVADLNNDKVPDMVVGGMVGSHVLINRPMKETREVYDAWMPKPVDDQAWLIALEERAKRGPVNPPTSKPKNNRSAMVGPAPIKLGADGRVAGSIEAEALRVVSASSGSATVQSMNGFPKSLWSNSKQLFWTAGKQDAVLELDFESPTNTSEVYAAFTKAGDYATIRCAIDDGELGPPIDLYAADVVNSGEVSLGKVRLTAGKHRLKIVVTGKNEKAVPSYFVGLDYLRFN